MNIMTSPTRIDFDKFRLRRFIDRLIEIGEVEIHEEPVALARLSAIIEATPKAVLFQRAGPEQVELVAAVSGSRGRLAAAFGSSAREVVHEYARRLANPQKVIEVPSSEAPVHQVVLQGKDIDLTKLPFHVQHEFDGGPYISAGIDYSRDPLTGRSNVGIRRLSLRSRDTMRCDLTDLSDLKRIYLGCLERKEKLPISFALGSHPLNYLAAGLKHPGDENDLAATLRGEPVPMVRGLTNDILAPADAEMIVEGFFDELGYREMEGPYGEFYGNYGTPHLNPVFHVTAITHRVDRLHQTVLNGGKYLSRTDSANLGSLIAELRIWRALRGVGIEPAAVRTVPATNGRQHARVALKRGMPGQGRLALAALLAVSVVKHAFVVDDDIDVFNDEEMEWAMSVRFRADRDLVVNAGYPAFYTDPAMDAEGKIAKCGFDLTRAYNEKETVEDWIAVAPRFDRKVARAGTVREALASGPKYFADLMQALGSEDGREIALELDRLREEGVLTRMEPNGEWALKNGSRRSP